MVPISSVLHLHLALRLLRVTPATSSQPGVGLGPVAERHQRAGRGAGLRDVLASEHTVGWLDHCSQGQARQAVQRQPPMLAFDGGQRCDGCVQSRAASRRSRLRDRLTRRCTGCTRRNGGSARLAKPAFAACPIHAALCGSVPATTLSAHWGQMCLVRS